MFGVPAHQDDLGFGFGNSPVVSDSPTAAVRVPADDHGRRRSEFSVYARVLDSMASGVMLIDAQGTITTFNDAAGLLLGLNPTHVRDRPFAEVFMIEESFDAFNEAILAAVYEGSVGDQRVVTVDVRGLPVPLSISTSYLRDESGGTSTRLGVVAVFSDISEIEQLRAREIELAGDLEMKHAELRVAFVSLESRNRELAALLRKIRTARVVAAGFALVLAAAIGGWLWFQPIVDLRGPAETSPAASAGAVRSVVVRPAGVTTTLTVAAEIAPRREVPVRAPVDGTVGVMHVQPGSAVEAGEPLLDLDVAQVRIERRAAEIAHLRAKAEVDALRAWESGVEVSGARRALTKARLASEAAKARAAEVAFLVEQGLTPAGRLTAAEREQRTHELDLEAAQQDLDAVLHKGREGLEVARLELANAVDALAKLDEVLSHSTLAAPVAGVVLPGRRGPGHAPFPTAGASVEAGAPLLTLGDMEGLTAKGRVDEVDIPSVRQGLGVRITGPAFPGLELTGRIVHVSSRASRAGGGRSLPSFSLVAAVDKIGPQERAAVRLGMSADMEIVIYDAPDALVVPVSAVDLSAGQPRVRLLDPGSDTPRLVDVAVGTTIVDGVEILHGLSAGDRVLVR